MICQHMAVKTTGVPQLSS